MADAENMSEAERRRARRRQRILENQGSRMDKILGGTAKSTNGDGNVNDERASSSSSASTFKKVDGPENPEIFLSSSVQSHSKERSDKSSNTNLPELLKELSEDFSGLKSSAITNVGEPKMGVQADGTVLLPRIPYNVGRIMICMLALFLSVMGAKNFVVTFISFELAYYFLNGLPPSPPPNAVLVALALVGMKESQLQLLKKIMHMVDRATVDFCLFLTFVMLPHAIPNILQTLYTPV